MTNFKSRRDSQNNNFQRLQSQKSGNHASRNDQPNQQDMLYFFQHANFIDAERLARNILINDPINFMALSVLGECQRLGGQFQMALATKRRLVKYFPQRPDTYFNLGNLFLELGQLSNAEGCYRHALRLNPQFGLFRLSLATILVALGRQAEAEEHFRHTLALDPENPEACGSLGSLLASQGRLSEAEPVLRKAMQLLPDNPLVCSLLGSVLASRGQTDEAMALLTRSISLQPDLAEGHGNFGKALLNMGQLTEAEAAIKKALQINPNYTIAYNNLGVVLSDSGRLSEAENIFRKALALDRNYIYALNNLGNVLEKLGRSEEAEACYLKAIALYPDYLEAHSNLIFSLNYHGRSDSLKVLATAKKYGAIATKKAEKIFFPNPLSPTAKPLRIGLVSGDIRNHPVGHFLQSLLTHADPDYNTFFAYSTSIREDELTLRVRPHLVGFRNLSGLTDAEAAQLIHSDELHILIDLSGHTANNRLPLFAYKPAPIQMSWLGYCGTTGMAEMDYIIGDKYVIPPQEEHHFLERILRLEDTYACYTPPDIDIQVAELPALTNNYITFGSFGNVVKINQDVADLWCEILQAIPESRLYLKSKDFHDEGASSNIRQLFSLKGIGPQRLIIEAGSNYAEYLATYDKIDIVLDTFTYPGFTTSAEALWMGVPVITLQGKRFIAHNGECLAHGTCQPEWIARDESDYLGKAIAFSSDLVYLSHYRRSLRNRLLSTPFLDASKFARNFQTAMQKAWDEYIRGPITAEKSL